MGTILSIMNESFPPKPTWTANDIEDLSGKVVIVTGGNSGLGKETVKALLAHNATVYMASRSEEKATSAIQELEDETGKKAIFLKLDLSDLDSVEQAAKEFLEKESRLDILYNSGGVMIPPIEQLSAQGYDLQFGTNVLGHFYLTKLLLPVLISTGKSNPESKARVISMSSGAHHLAGLSYDTLKEGKPRRKLGNESLYAQSKFAIVVFAKELGRRYGDQNIVSTSINPGNIKTGLQRHVKGIKSWFIAPMLYPLVPNGALTLLWAGTAKETADHNGKYLIAWGRVGKPIPASVDPATGEKLWEWLEEQVAGRSAVVA